MSLRKHINRLLKPLGYELAKKHLGRHLWEDVDAFVDPARAALILDIGANEGQSGQDFLKRFPRADIHSFEPSPKIFERLQAATSAHTRWHCHQLALGATPGKATLNENTFHQASSLLPAHAQSGAYLSNVLEPLATTEVEVTTLDAFAAGHGMDRIDVAKLDVQGFENEVLKGAHQLLQNQRIKALSLEVNLAPLYDGQAAFETLHALLNSHRYRLVGLYDNAYTPQKHLMWCDLLYTPESPA